MDPNDLKPENEEASLEDAIFQNVGAVEEEPDPVAAPVEGEPAKPEDEPAKEEAPPVEEELKPELSDDEKAVEDEMKALGLTKEDTQKRFRELANEAREARELRAVNEQQNKIFQHLEQAGVGAEQFGLMTAIAADVNSGDPIRLDRAYQAMLAEVTDLAKKLGKPAPGYDPVAEHADLKQKVDDGELSPEDAQLVANARRTSAATQQHAQTRQQQESHEIARNQARDALNGLEVELRTKDPNYAAKRAILEPLMRQVFPTLPPEKWPATYAEAYAKVQLPAAQAAPIRRPDPAASQRPNAAAGSAQPKNAEEAVMAALGLTPGA